MKKQEKIVDKLWLSNSNETKVQETENGEEEEEEAALSLCDLPIKEQTRQMTQSNKQIPQENKPIQDEFDFCSFSKDSHMCPADQLFFKGQILPLINSISSRGSNQHSSSRSGGSTTPIQNPILPNKFISLPTPKPQIKFSRIKNQNMQNSYQKSRMWSLFMLGLVTTPEIVLEDLKNRPINKSLKKKKKQKKQGISSFEVNGTLFSTCKCSSSAVNIVPSRIVAIKRSVSAKDELKHEELKGTKQEEEGKQLISHHRTFEWLKQLSLDT